MCRNIRTLFNFAPPATEDEIRAAALQFVRKYDVDTGKFLQFWTGIVTLA